MAGIFKECWDKNPDGNYRQHESKQMLFRFLVVQRWTNSVFLTPLTLSLVWFFYDICLKLTWKERKFLDIKISHKNFWSTFGLYFTERSFYNFLWVILNRAFWSVVFYSSQKMVLRRFYFIRALTKALTNYYINRSQRHLLAAIKNNLLEGPIPCNVDLWNCFMNLAFSAI